MRSIAMRSIAAFAVTLLIAPVVHAQGGSAELELKKKMAAESGALAPPSPAPRIPLERPIKGAPYSADTIVESAQTLADGNHINRRSSGHVYRDGEGRVRREEERAFTLKTPNGPVSATMPSITIVDPVGGYSYSLDTEHKIAWRTPMEASRVVLDKVQLSMAEEQAKKQAELNAQEKAVVAEANRRKAELDARKADVQKAEAQLKAEQEKVQVRLNGQEMRIGFSSATQGPLEHKTIDGLAVDGHKNSEVIPAGAIGNEQPITITSEEWRSPELQVLVLTRHSDPRSGDSTYRLANVIRAEPDPSLFMVPPDFTVKDTGIKRNPN